MSTNRRSFLKTFLRGAGCFAVSVAVPFRPLHAARPRPNPAHHFPQGVASGDPTPDSILLWTRVQRTEPPPTQRPVPLTVQISRTADFQTVLAERRVTATAASDHTVRVFVHGLPTDTVLYYRFLAPDGTPSRRGRTRTAPAPTADRPVHLAFASCQAYEAGYYGIYRTLIREDEAAPPEEQIDFVLHLGDFIYEGLGYGGARSVSPFPAGGRHGDGTWHAETVDDYRHLYRTYLSDPDLQAARARWPFVQVWDDHEFTNDAWQSASTYDAGDEPAQARKVAANQAWFEYIPARLSEHEGSPAAPSQADDFRSAAVRNAPLDATDRTGLVNEPNNRAAVGSMTIYRNFRWGQHLELVLTDGRSYRTPHPVPPPLNQQLAGSDRYLTPLDVVEVFDAGRAYNNGTPPETVTVGEQEIPNTRRTAAPGSMLGARQKAWWKQVVRESTATWTVWGHGVPLMPMRLDLDAVDPNAQTVVMTTDTWDGYLTERRELLAFAKEAGTPLVSLSGDNHNSFAGQLYPSFAGDGAAPMGTEFSICGVSSPSLYRAFAQALPEDSPLRPLVTFDDPSAGEAVEALNLTFLYGAKASAVAARTGNLAQAKTAGSRLNDHLAYVDSNAYGIGRATVHGEGVDVELLTTPPPTTPPGDDGIAVVRRARFTTTKAGDGAAVALQGPTIDGPAPFPL
ncbi:alkaline phosphatase D family protein [Salisaeta longa]|uniref:alkaline phosphatase D family protein n=1 Tax=Salisaeta longa TaxID=503170 RepID=UPI0003B2FF29|nr:alkaline phosphatase D family protein [Salisaeta longa]